MGPHREAHITKKKELAELKAKVAMYQSEIDRESTREAEKDIQISRLATEATSHPKALKDQRAAIEEKEIHRLQQQNWTRKAAPIRDLITAAEKELPNFAYAELCEIAAEHGKTIAVLGARISGIISPITRACAEVNRDFATFAAESMHLISGGDPERVRGLDARVSRAFVRGIQAELANGFHSVGLNILDVGTSGGRSFQDVVGSVIRTLIDALEISLYSTAATTPRRARFRCCTNISSLYGLNFEWAKLFLCPPEMKR